MAVKTSSLERTNKFMTRVPKNNLQKGTGTPVPTTGQLWPRGK